MGGPALSWEIRNVPEVPPLERRARRRGAKEAPRLTQARLKFLGLNLDFSIEKAKRELGYRPKVSFDQGIQETMAWYRQTT